MLEAMIFISAALAVIAAPEHSPAEPPTQVMLRIVEAAAATNHEIALEFVGLSSGETRAINELFSRTGAFAVSARSTTRARVERIDDEHVRVTVSRGEQVLSEEEVHWPAERHSGEELPESQRPDLASYEREALHIEALATIQLRSLDTGAGWGELGSRPPPTLDQSDAWVIVRGRNEIIDDAELARRLEDSQLLEQIENERYWPKFWWRLGFGASAAASVGVGVPLAVTEGRSTRQTAGVSLIAVGAALGVLAAIYEQLGTQHVLTRVQAQELVALHNARLRERLGVKSPADDGPPPP